MPSLADFIGAADQLKVAHLRACDFGHTLRDVRKGDFVYLDPPFFVAARRVFRDYGPRKFLQEDLDRLGRHLDAIDARGARFVLSFADCADVRPLVQNWANRRVRVRRQIAGFAGDRRFAYEVIVSNTEPLGGK
jgi:DNA adenine methylase